MRCVAMLAACAGAILIGCQPTTRLAERAGADVPMFAPIDVRVHPFTSVKSWEGDERPEGIEALIELQDRFRDPTKATGTVLFELYTYRRNYPDPRGDRLAAWKGSLMTLEEQRLHWNRISRTYSFQLVYPEIRADRSYVLMVWFDQGGRRLTSQVILEGQAQEASDGGATARVPTTQPTSRPATSPAAR